MRVALLAYLDSYRTADISARLALFANDAQFEDPVGTEPICGHAALRTFWEAGAGFDIRLEPELVSVNGREAACVFTAHISRGEGDAAHIRTIETIEVDATGLIVRMRAYFDTGSIS